MKKAAIYARVSTPDQHVENQLYQLRELAARRGFEVVHSIRISASPAPKRGAEGWTPCWRMPTAASFPLSWLRPSTELPGQSSIS